MSTMPAMQNRDNAKEQLRQLIKLFQTNIDQYKSPSYKEANVRPDFIDRFFKLLGWDVDNNERHSEQSRDVIRETRLKIDNRPKAPDYEFRLGGKTQFYVEAKHPSIHIYTHVESALQLRRYGYTANLPLSILTDFEEFAVYNTRIKPHENDKATVAQEFYCKFDQYLEKSKVVGYETNFDYIVDTFSKEAVRSGSLNRYIQSNKHKKGTSTVDQELLALVEQWRIVIARNITKNNPELASFNLNTAVQRIVDRILFLRIAEDRGIEGYENLLDAAQSHGIYNKLQHLFVLADKKYNAGLFRQENWLDNIVVDDKVLAPIIKGLYRPQCPYAFTVLPIEILGSIYERFLGKTIVLSPSHVAKVEEKPEVRKAGGVYYTPQYIVDYIVAETVGRKLKPENSNKAKTLPTVSVLDPACGSGSFLVGAYTFLLDEHLSFYLEEANLKKSLKTGLIYEFGPKTYRLSIEEKQRILLGSIFGVDIDPIAVEVTKLSLYLKLLENENDESAKLLFKYSDLKMLPDLDSNIRCGNSLIGSDFYQNKDMPLFGDEAIRRINAFDWHKEFPTVFSPVSEKRAEAGFDCVIGNPPYVRQETLDEATKEYFQTHYLVYHGTADLYAYFIEKGIGLLKDGGNYGVIVANKWLRANYGEPLRKWLKTWSMLEIVDFGDLPVFGKVTAYPMIFRIEKVRKNGKKLLISQVESLAFETLEEHLKEKRQVIDSDSLDSSGWQLRDEREKKLFDKMMAIGVPMKAYVSGRILFGIKTGLNEAFVIDEATKKRLLKEDKRSKKLIKPIIWGRDIKRYASLIAKKHLILIPKGFTNESCQNYRASWKWFSENFPAIAAHLEPHQKKAKKRCDQGDYWWELRACDYYSDFELPKIMFPDIASHMQASLETQGVLGDATSFIIPTSDKYLLALLNSKLVHFLFTNISATIRGGYLRYKKFYIERLPIYRIDEKSKREVAKRDKLVSLVDQMISAQERLRLAVSDSDTRTCRQRVDALDAQIDTIVYDVYGLTEEEIKIVEG